MKPNNSMMRIVFFILFTSLPTLGYGQAQAIQITPKQAMSIGKRIWQNEGAGKVENLTVWNKGEAFPSFGIGHFIWYPAGINGPFKESFPALLEFIGQTQTLPRWLSPASDAPWESREAFYADINSRKMHQLREFLQQTIPLQVEFIIQRMSNALPSILADVESQPLRQHIQKQFFRIAAQTNGPYALIDYVNFKGEGTSPKERYQGQGWGLLQVLAHIDPDNKDVMNAFVEAADHVLTRRVHNAPRDESRWLPGWRKRLRTYL